MRKYIILFAIVFTSLAAFSDDIDHKLAAKYFAEARDLSARDDGKLWGVRLCGPILFGSYSSPQLVANSSDPNGTFHQDGDVWVAARPQDLSIANSALSFAGVDWTTLIWPLPQFKQDRQLLLAHECFHRIQSSVHAPAANAIAVHLETTAGRLWMQLEWRALQKALRLSGDERRAAIQDALRFRAYRQSQFPQARASETALEIGEGLAEYTGVKLAARDSADELFLAQLALHNGPEKRTFSRSFAYASGPAYGLLLDATDPTWKKSLNDHSDLGAMLATAYRLKIDVPAEAAAQQTAAKYDGDDLAALEMRREEERIRKGINVRKLFLDGPVMVLPAERNFSYGFNPNAVFSLDEDHIVYFESRVSGDWGQVTARDGAIMIVRENGKNVRAQVPLTGAESSTKGAGWEFHLNPGWQIVPGARAGDKTVVPTK